MAKNKMADVMKMERKAEKQLKEDVAMQLEAAVKAQQDKLDKSKAHLIAQLDMASKKYLTVNGYMQARSTIQVAAFENNEGADGFDYLARQIASEMAELAGLMAREIESIDVFDLDDSVIEKHLEDQFVKSDHSLAEVVRQLLIVNLLQNVGPSIDDIIEFRDATQDEIAKLTETIEE